MLKAQCFLFLFIITGCASYQSKMSQPLIYLQNGQAHKAAEFLKEKAFQDSKDQLAYLLDYSLAQQLAGNYKESNLGFQRAFDLADWNDYHSISKIGASLLLNEGMVQYKGDEYEKLLIPVYSALNFLMQQDYQAARVEVRRIHERINQLEMDGEKVHQEMPLAFYLSAMIWEQNGNLDSAYIDYKNTYKHARNFTAVKKDLLRLSAKLGRWSDYKEYKKKFSDVKLDKLKKDEGQLVLIYQQGRGPKKLPHPNWHRIPKVFPTSSAGVQARLSIKEKNKSITTSTLLDIDYLAESTMEKQYAALIAKRAAGIATKAVVSKQIEKENQTLGQIAWIAMNIADQADLRQWISLPASIQVAKTNLKAGKYKVQIEALTAQGRASGESYQLEDLEVQAGKITFINWRSFK